MYVYLPFEPRRTESLLARLSLEPPEDVLLDVLRTYLAMEKGLGNADAILRQLRVEHQGLAAAELVAAVAGEPSSAGLPPVAGVAEFALSDEVVDTAWAVAVKRAHLLNEGLVDRLARVRARRARSRFESAVRRWPSEGPSVELLHHRPNMKHATPEDDAAFALLIDTLRTLDRADPRQSPSVPTLEPDAAMRLALLNERADGLRCVLRWHPYEEPVVFLDVIVHPIWSLIVAAPFVDALDASGACSLPRRAWCRSVLEVVALLAGDQRLGVLAMMVDEAASAEEFGEAYPRSLSALFSLAIWAVGELESSLAVGTAESVVESAPSLVAARFELTLRALWPSCRPAFEWTACLPTAVRGTATRWEETRARVRALTDATETAEQGGEAAVSDAAPGDLVMVPGKGVTIVLENLPSAHVVARPARPQRTTAWYPRGRLAVCCKDAAVPFFGAPSVEALRAESSLSDRLQPLREPVGAAGYAALTRYELDEPFGLERWLGRGGAADARAYPVRPRHALEHAILHLTVPCDPVLARVALECAKSDAPNESIEDHDVRALAGWLDGDALDDVSDRLTALLTAAEESSARSAFALEERALRLASLGRWTEARTLAKRGLALAKRQAERSDSKEAALGECHVNAFEILSAFAATPGAPPSPELQARLRREALLVIESHDVLGAVHWLRVLHRHAGLSPREVILTSYFELPHGRGARVPPASLEAEVAALKARVGHVDPGPAWRPTWEAQHTAMAKKAKAKAAKSAAPKPEDPRVEEAKAEEAKAEATPYARDTHFKVGELVAHPKFGVGRVKSLPRPDAIEVVFDLGGVRVLLHRPS